MNILTLLIIVLLAVSANCALYEVLNTTQLTFALQNVLPGDTIHVHNGLYSGNFPINRSGQPGLEINLNGTKEVIITNTLGYGLQLNKASYWIINNFTIANSSKGIVLNDASNNLLDNIIVYNTDEEGILVIGNSSDNAIRNCTIYNTGLKNPAFGSGISVGQSANYWVNGRPDFPTQNDILNCIIGPNVTSECIDLKEGSVGGNIRGNYLDSTRVNGNTYSESSLSVKGTYYVVEDNISENSRLFGFDVTRIIAGGGNFSAGSVYSGCGNVIRNNQCKRIPWNGFCAVNQSPDCINSAGCSNTVVNNNIII